MNLDTDMPVFKKRNRKYHALVLSKLPPDVPGGVEAALADLLINLDKHDVKYKFIPTGCSKSMRILGNRIKFFNLLKVIIYFFRVNLIIIHVPNPVQSIAILFLQKIFGGKQIILFYHSEVLVMGKLGSSINLLEKKLCSVANTAIFSSLRYAQSVLGIMISRVNVMILSYNTRIKTVEPISVKGLPDRYALSFGRLAPYKNLELLNALSLQHPEIDVVLAGPLDTRLGLKFDKNIHVISRNFLEGEKRYLLENAEFLIFPSTSRAETFGITQLEALTLGTPVINYNTSTSVGSVNEYGKYGVCVELSGNDPEKDFIHEIYRLWQDPAKIRLLKRKCKSAFDNRQNSYEIFVKRDLSQFL